MHKLQLIVLFMLIVPCLLRLNPNEPKNKIFKDFSVSYKYENNKVNFESIEKDNKTMDKKVEENNNITSNVNIQETPGDQSNNSSLQEVQVYENEKLGIEIETPTNVTHADQFKESSNLTDNSHALNVDLRDSNIVERNLENITENIQGEIETPIISQLKDNISETNGDKKREEFTSKELSAEEELNIEEPITDQDPFIEYEYNSIPTPDQIEHNSDNYLSINEVVQDESQNFENLPNEEIESNHNVADPFVTSNQYTKEIEFENATETGENILKDYHTEEIKSENPADSGLRQIINKNYKDFKIDNYVNIFSQSVANFHKYIKQFIPYPYDLIIFFLIGYYLAKFLTFALRTSNIIIKPFQT